MSSIDKLSAQQRILLDHWLPGFTVLHNHSWGLVGTTVLELSHKGQRFIAKAGDARDHHLARELRAHREWLAPWAATSAESARSPELVYADGAAKLLVTRYLPGVLVEGTLAEHGPDIHRQAGSLLARLHAQLQNQDAGYEDRARNKSLAWLDRPHRIATDVENHLRVVLAGWPTPPAVLVPTHGDWQPRNWLVHDGRVSVIDFGRADLRPAMTDFARLAAQQWRNAPALEAAFIEGYGQDPREPEAWRRLRISEAIGTAVWAFEVGNTAFEHQGHRMIADALEDWERHPSQLAASCNRRWTFITSVLPAKTTHAAIAQDRFGS
jgi:tRNA A-37 threonylcarbamoyl transferase component Bud32